MGRKILLHLRSVRRVYHFPVRVLLALLVYVYAVASEVEGPVQNGIGEMLPAACLSVLLVRYAASIPSPSLVLLAALWRFHSVEAMHQYISKPHVRYFLIDAAGWLLIVTATLRTAHVSIIRVFWTQSQRYTSVRPGRRYDRRHALVPTAGRQGVIGPVAKSCW